MLSKGFFESIYRMSEGSISDNYDYICDSKRMGGCGLGYQYYCYLDKEVAIETTDKNGNKKVVTGILLGYNKTKSEVAKEKEDRDLAMDYAELLVRKFGAENLNSMVEEAKAKKNNHFLEWEEIEDIIRGPVEDFIKSKNPKKLEDEAFMKEVLEDTAYVMQGWN
jgi:hypothetical protein